MKIIDVEITRLKEYENNPRVNDKAVDKVAASIREFGFKVPIVIDTDNVIICGHTRLKAARRLGLDVVPCIVADDLTDEQIRAFRLADNKTGEFAEWDFAKLDAELAALADIDFDMEQFGFEFDSTDEETTVVEDEAPAVDEEAPPVTKLGDIWQLGRHRLMCGDSTDAASVALLMNGTKADICFTSPPYNAGEFDIDGQEATKKKYNSYDDNKNEVDYLRFIKENVRIMLNNATEVFYNIGLVENNKRSIIKLQMEFIDRYKDVIYWKKSTVAPHIQPGVINNLVEFIICFGNGKRKFENAQFSQGTYWNVIEGSNASGNEYSKIHKATFPMYLPENIIKNFSPKHGCVIDCFGGTGTTLIACEQLDRTCFMMELDPKYCDVIVKRWETLTGEKAVLL